MSDKLTVIGIQHRKGTFNNVEYDNTIFHCIREADTKKDEIGNICDVIKVKTSNLHTMPGINDCIVPLYNRFGQVQSVSIV